MNQTKNENKMPFPWLAAATGVQSLLNIGAGKRQQKRNTELWQMNNDYNHPSAQMARLREAGLNPNLIYGDSVSGASGGSSSAPESAQRQKADLTGPIQTYQQMKNTGLVNDNLREQNTVLKNTALEKSANAILIARNAGIKTHELDVLNNTFGTQVEALRADQKNKVIDWERNEQKFKTEQLTKRDIIRINSANVEKHFIGLKQAKQNLTNSEKLQKLRELEIDLKEKNVKFYDSTKILSMFSQIMGLRK